MSDTTNNKPTASKQFDRVQAAIWRQESEGGGGEPFYSLTVSRSYRDANNQWQRSTSFLARDLPHLKLAIEWAMQELLLNAE